MKTNIQELALTSPPDFHDVRLSRYREWASSKLFFKSEDIYLEMETVDVTKVIGHSQGYGTMTWGEMLRNNERTNSNLERLAKNPEYYLSDDHDNSDWSFIKVDEKYFIATGKHRTTILRYFGHYNPQLFPDGVLARGVHVIKKSLDHETMDTLNKIALLLKNPDFSHLTISYMDRNYDGKDAFVLKNPLQQATLFYQRNQLSDLLNELEHSTPFRRFLGIGKQCCFRRSMWTGFGGGYSN